MPIKPVATVLVADPDKGKGKEVNLEDVHSDTGDGTDTAGSASDERYVAWRMFCFFLASCEVLFSLVQAPCEWNLVLGSRVYMETAWNIHKTTFFVPRYNV